MAFYSIPPQGYFVKYSNRAFQQFEYQHFFCGTHKVTGAWCPNCDKPLLRLLTLCTADPLLGLVYCPLSQLPLFFCFTCRIQEESFYYLLENNEIVLLKYGQGETQWGIPYEDYPTFFPEAPARLIRMPNEVQVLFKLFNRGIISWPEMENATPELALEADRPQHQIGGEPFLSQRNPDYEMECPLCKKTMPFLACLANDCLDPRGLMGNRWAQVLYNYCHCCGTVGAFCQCD